MAAEIADVLLASLDTRCQGWCDCPGCPQILDVAAIPGAREHVLHPLVIFGPKAQESTSGAGASN